MKWEKYGWIVAVLVLACACLIAVGCATNQPGAAAAPPPNSGRLLVYRVANFGTHNLLMLSIDGKDMGIFSEGTNYDGYLSAGQHVLVARSDALRAQPARKTLTIKAGQTYSYTATWSDINLVLVRNQ